MVEADIRREAGEFESPENVPVRLRTQVGPKCFLGFPPLEEHSRGFRPLFLTDVAGQAAGLGLHRSLDGPKDLEHFRPPFRIQRDSEGSDDHCVGP